MDNEIILEIKNGRADLMEQLWLQLEKLIFWYAKKYYTGLSAYGSVPGGVEIKDLVQCGYFGLLEAVEHYQPEQGASFTTFLLWYLRKAFQDCIGRTERRWNDPLNNYKSLYDPLYDDDGTILLDTVSDGKSYSLPVEARIFKEQLHKALDDALCLLPEKESSVLRAVFYEGKSQKEIAAEVGCKNIYAIKREALNHIRNSSSKRKLEAFIDLRTDFYKAYSVHAIEKKMLYREKMRNDQMRKNNTGEG